MRKTLPTTPTMTHDPTVPPGPPREGVAIAILARRAELGKGKTRLAASMGAEAAHEVYLRLIRLCAATVRESGLPATVFFEPAPGDFDVWPREAFRHGMQVQSRDLGDRMGAAAITLLAAHTGVLIIGTDCPHLNAQHLRTAAEQLAEVDVVLGPSLDGGYYLIGFRKFRGEIFENITWSTDAVAEQTRRVLAKAGLSHYELPTLSDIDVEADWDTYLAGQHNSWPPDLISIPFGKTNNMGKTLLIILLVVAVVLGFMGCGKYNGFVQQDENVNAAWADVETQYQRRTDLIGQVVSTVKGAANFERETLESVIEARSRATSIQLTADDLTEENLAKFQAAQDQLGSSLGRLLATAEAYPQLQTTSQFRDLQVQIEGTENRIAVARKRFNDAATGYNADIRTFPNNFFAGVFGFDRRALFQADPGSAKAPVIDFN